MLGDVDESHWAGGRKASGVRLLGLAALAWTQPMLHTAQAIAQCKFAISNRSFLLNNSWPSFLYHAWLSILFVYAPVDCVGDMERQSLDFLSPMPSWINRASKYTRLMVSINMAAISAHVAGITSDICHSKEAL